MKRSVCAILAMAFLLVAFPAWAAGVSQATMLFLKIAPGARPSGMGEAFVAMADEATAVWWNPAGLGFQQQKQFTAMYARWLPQFKLSDLYYSYLGYVHDVPDWGTFGGNIIFLNLGETERRDEQNRSLGTFSSFELAIAGAYGAKVNENLTMGVGLKIIYSNLSPFGAGAEKGTGTATAVAADIGLLYKTTFLRGLSMGANLSNMGPKVAYIDRAQADPLPTNLKLGVAYHVIDQEYNKLTVATDINKELVVRHDDGSSDEFYAALFTAWTDQDLIKSIIWNVGAEYWYGNLVGLRVGYWNDDLGKVFPITFGVSLQYSVYRFDFSYLNAGENHPLSDTMRYSLSVGF
ncbi:MAG: PorV/PorQ family protein [Calditrichaeota bacterium]|nr:PorV/PorQ family protein [Calditrichota bacterium]